MRRVVTPMMRHYGSNKYLSGKNKNIYQSGLIDIAITSIICVDRKGHNSHLINSIFTVTRARLQKYLRPIFYNFRLKYGINKYFQGITFGSEVFFEVWVGLQETMEFVQDDLTRMAWSLMLSSMIHITLYILFMNAWLEINH